MSEEMKQDGLQEEEIQAETAETAQEEAPAEAPAEEKKEMSAEDEALNIKYMRLMADFQNFKRRTEKEKSDIYAYANEKFALDLLDVIDNFERALIHQDDCKDEKMKEGMELIFKQLQSVLEKNKIVEINALGEDFDPNVHNAVMTSPSEEFESGKVCNVFQKGYKLNNKVIRPAMVIVAE
jgi:molecular chaperone GrpE